jgi:hypothetical protein
MPDQNEIVNGPGVGHHQPHAARARGALSRAVPAPDLRGYTLQTRHEP